MDLRRAAGGALSRPPMKRRRLLCAALAVATAGGVRGQQTVPLPRVVWISQGTALVLKPALEAFLAGLRGAGHVDGRTFRLESHYAEGNLERSGQMIRAAAASRPAVLCVTGLTAARRAHDATKTVPIVMMTGSDLVDAGLARSHARPGYNVTGVADNSDDILVKRFEYARELLPFAKRCALVVNPDFPATPKMERRMTEATQATGVSLVVLRARDLQSLESAVDSLGPRGTDMLLVGGDALFVVGAKPMIDKAMSLAIPVVHYWPTTPEFGAVLTYAVDVLDNFRRSAWHVDRILKGEAPGTLPIHQPTRYELIINLQAARKLAIVVPAALLARADRRID